MVNQTPHIVILSYDEKKINKFVSYLMSIFEPLESYEKADTYKLTFDRNDFHSDNGSFFAFKEVAKVAIVNKYYSAEVTISSCVVQSGEHAIRVKENLPNLPDLEGDDEAEPQSQNQTNELDAKDILCESFIFLFNNFSKEEKNLVNVNPFRNYDEDCVEYVKDPETQQMIRNANFDFSNMYKDVGVKIAIFPSSLEKDNKDIVNFFSDYFIECLYINYESKCLEEGDEHGESDSNCPDEGDQNVKEENTQLREFEEQEDEERLIEALHCHMWKGLQIKRDHLIIQHRRDFPMSQTFKGDEASPSGDNLPQSDKTAPNGENPLQSDKAAPGGAAEIDPNGTVANGVKTPEGQKEELFMENFNKIVEKIRIAKMENKNCSSHSARRKKAEEVIFELQQYFCDIDEDLGTMKLSYAINKLIASLGGVLLVAYDVIRIHKSNINYVDHNTYIMDNPYVPFSTFVILSFTYLFLNGFSNSKNVMAKGFTGFLSCFLITYALVFSAHQLYLTSEFTKAESDLLKDSTYLCIFLFFYFCSLCIEAHRNLSRTLSTKESIGGSVKIEV
ncbi:hypothetical protein C922_01385 [Plasmodium inui San Antonio 1]|uniref:Uncharacterized protein n=1 Tax=Plasmodium inui San Antonio 1 TaxID=1237626 RepID=W7A9K5_9APIC|nr:hypothetical protein C922_01385 [Plasmodium inui San Antonio 1]EUD68365.1 hypothetical protein C922_01385 [Plasmodium inui San Antonio 1]